MFGKNKGFIFTIDLLLFLIVIIGLFVYMGNMPKTQTFKGDLTYKEANAVLTGQKINENNVGFKQYECKTFNTILLTQNTNLNENKVCVGK